MHNEPVNLSDAAVQQLTKMFALESGTNQKPTFSFDQANNLTFCAKVIAETLNIHLNNIKADISTLQEFEYLMDDANIRFRRVELTPEWWQNDNGPLLVFLKANNAACVLLYKPAKGYYLLNPAQPQPQYITEEIAATFADKAYMFYKPLPDRALTWRDIIKFTWTEQKSAIQRLLFLQCLLGLLSLLTPIVTGKLIAEAIPTADTSLFKQLISLLFINSITATFFTIALSLIVLKLRFKINVSLQAALWDRLLRLPVNFFRRFTAGDLATRAHGVDFIQQEITNSFLQGLFSITVALFSLVLMFCYAPWLAILALFIALIYLAVYMLAYRKTIEFALKSLTLQGKLSGMLLQYLTGLNKLKVANAQKSAFAKWLTLFIDETFNNYNTGKLMAITATFNAGFSVVAFIIIFIVVALLNDKLSFGDFISFNAAFTQFYTALSIIVTAIMSALQIIPLVKRMAPITTSIPEIAAANADPGTLTGKLTVTNACFRYQANSAWILDNICLAIEPGNLVALVGPSGSGKSTLFRVLLGFEALEKGQVLYDDKDLTKLNLRKFRNQLGVVLQNGSLLPGTIYDNIAAGALLTIEQAWEAARLACLADEIASMPMNMHTLIMEGGKTLSQGQRQRLMLAQALAKQPRLLLLDEATSALDNITQAKIQANLASLNITRIIIAHRLSTVIEADYIYVMNEGKIVQAGTYRELINSGGLFADLAKQQLY